MQRLELPLFERNTRDSLETKEYRQKFVDGVNAVVLNFHGRVVEEFSVEFEFDAMLVVCLDSWVDFAVSSRTKSIALHLLPAKGRRVDHDRYVFPSHLLDGESISRLQRLQLSFVSFRPPPEFGGFPALRKLDLNYVDITRKDLQAILCNCSNLEWLSLVRCFLNDELKLDHLFSGLRHLTVAYCKVTRIQLQVTKLLTLVHRGDFVPIVINQHSKLENAHIQFFRGNFSSCCQCTSEWYSGHSKSDFTDYFPTT
jgi:hypothetical protein